MMPLISREDDESSEVSLKDVCSRGRAHLERAHQESEGSHAMVRSLAESFGVKVIRQDGHVDEQRCEELLGIGDTPGFPHSGQWHRERSHLRMQHQRLVHGEWTVDELLEESEYESTQRRSAARRIMNPAALRLEAFSYFES